jgi:hypothetical protein
MPANNRCHNPGCSRKFGLVRRWLVTFHGYRAFCSEGCLLDFKRQTERHKAYLRWLYYPP